jgi:hypothetical protein
VVLTEGFSGHGHDGGVVGLKAESEVVGQAGRLGVLVVLDVDELVWLDEERKREEEEVSQAARGERK